MKRVNGYYVNQHSCFLLQYHLVLVTKFRYSVIDKELKAALIDYTNKYFKERDCNVLAINSDKDHLQIIFEAYPHLNLAQFINAYKSASSRRMRTDFKDYLSSYYWKPYFWSQSYFLGTVSERTTSIVQKYINDQGVQ